MGKYSQYKVQLAALPDGKYEQDFVCDTDFFRNMENPDIQSADVHVHLVMVKKNDAYDCTFTFRGHLAVPCDRCLDPLDHEVDTVWHVTVKYGDTYDCSDDDILIVPEKDAYLNVAYMLYDTIVLTIPLRHVHPAGKCNRAMTEVLHRHGAGFQGGEDEAGLTAAEDEEES